MFKMALPNFYDAGREVSTLTRFESAYESTKFSFVKITERTRN